MISAILSIPPTSVFPFFMTIATLRSLHAIIGDAIGDIERVYSLHGYSTTVEPTSSSRTPDRTAATSEDTPNSTDSVSSTTTTQAYVSPPPSPSAPTSSHSASSSQSTSRTCPLLDFPCLDDPCDSTSLSETLTSDPVVLNAIGRIVAAAGQLSATAQLPFLTLCDAIMSYHLPSCMRFLEASHVVEILREAGPGGLHVDSISNKNGVKASKLAHILRLLATHHILREVSPDVFTLNRISSLVDSGKMFVDIKQYEDNGTPENKYRDTNGIAAFVGLNSDEIQKSSAYITETYYLSPSKQTREGQEPTLAPFCFAFHTIKTGTDFFGWLEGEERSQTRNINENGDLNIEKPPGTNLLPAIGISLPREKDQSLLQKIVPHIPYHKRKSSSSAAGPDRAAPPPISRSTIETTKGNIRNGNRFRLERFGKAMSGTDGWEAPGAALNGFDWYSLARGSIIVDVGGGIGSTSMLLATAFSSLTEEDDLDLKFIIQDRPIVCEMGERGWRAKCPDLLQSTVRFQVHDFFTPQPVRNAAVFLLRVVLHDWPDDYARRILLHLREAATHETKLLIADFILPLACPDDMSSDGGLEGVEGAESLPAPYPLLANLGKASANVYWMDMTMHAMFNSQERTLREMVNLAASAGWKITKVTRTPGSMFGYLVATPTSMPSQEPMTQALCDDLKPQGSQVSPGQDSEKSSYNKHYREDLAINMERVGSRCGTPTFGSSTRLSSIEETLLKFGGGLIRPRSMGRSFSSPSKPPFVPTALKPALSLSTSTSLGKKKRPSPLSVPPPIQSSPPPVHSSLSWKSPSTSSSPRRLQTPIPPTSQSPAPKIARRRLSLANLRPSQSQQNLHSIPVPPLPPLPVSSMQPPPSPLSPLYPQSSPSDLRRLSHSQAQFTQVSNATDCNGNNSSAVHHNKVGSFSGSPVPSMIPIRANEETHLPSHSSLLHPRSAVGITSSAIPTRRPIISRRASNAQLLLSSQPSSMSLRKRSGTVIGGDPCNGIEGDSAVPRSFGPNANQGKFSGISGLTNSGTGTALRFEDDRRVYVRSRAVSMKNSSCPPDFSAAVNDGSGLTVTAKTDGDKQVQ